MSDLFLPTLEMMGLTFAIGFFVAFIIKLIASAADSLDFYSSHQTMPRSTISVQQKDKEIQISCKSQPDKIWNHQITSCSRNFRKCFCT